jgi:hypothetical protein
MRMKCCSASAVAWRSITGKGLVPSWLVSCVQASTKALWASPRAAMRGSARRSTRPMHSWSPSVSQLAATRTTARGPTRRPSASRSARPLRRTSCSSRSICSGMSPSHSDTLRPISAVSSLASSSAMKAASQVRMRPLESVTAAASRSSAPAAGAGGAVAERRRTSRRCSSPDRNGVAATLLVTGSPRRRARSSTGRPWVRAVDSNSWTGPCER